MKKTKYDISIIIPVYNTEKLVEYTIKSVIDQKYDFSKIQLVIINDGSPDNSDEVIKPYAEQYSNITYIKKENEGVSKTRNLGLSLCEGRYILFLDSDDTISNDTVVSIVPFFDKHYDEIDLVSYRLIPIREGKQLKEHYRQKYLKETGVYDLRKKENWFASVTTMNYCVKNKFKDNVLFDENLMYHEDQKYSMDIIKEKMKIGFVDKGIYWYLQQPASTTNTKFYAYYLYEPTMSLWENVFNEFNGNPPEYFQALFINDINWKNQSGILMPYQYEGKKLDDELNRMRKIISNVNDEVIMNHPGVAFYHKFYWVNFKHNSGAKNKVLTANNAIAITRDESLLFVNSKITVDLLRFKVEDGNVEMLICLKSPAFMDTDSIPKLFISFDENDNDVKELSVRDSSYSYNGCKEKCCQFYISEIKFDYRNKKMFRFYVSLLDHNINTEIRFPLGNVFSDKIKRYEYLRDGYMFSFTNNVFYIENTDFMDRFKHNSKLFFKYLIHDRKRFVIRTIANLYRPRKKIWLYYDCNGVKKDNGYYQFIHDIEIEDGIKRYYVSNNSNEFNKGLFEGKLKNHVIKFKSLKHKIIYLKASKVITAFVELENRSPYTKSSYTSYIDIANIPEIIYLQHGILHAHMPWKYSYDRLGIDKEVISSYFEKENFVNNYGFTDEHLIDSGMPRYDFLTPDVEKTNTILYAPSWRSYLVGKQVTGYAKIEKEFKASEFYIESKKFLESKELAEMLEKYDFTLNFKLHPIFRKYEYLYKIKNDRIKIGADLPDSEYKVFITDFSSYVFDFIYLKRSIIYFIPDYIKFRSGMNLYRELDFKIDNGIGEFSQDSKTTLKLLNNILKNDGNPSKEQLEKMNNFFIHSDHKQRDRIYKNLTEKK